MIYVMLADGFEEIEALAFVDILRRAEISVKTVSVYGKDFVTGSHSISIVPDITLKEVGNDIEAIVLPGGMPGTKNLQLNTELTNLIMDSFHSGKYIAAICAAPSVLGKLGVLKGKKAVCYPGYEEMLEGAIVLKDKVITDGKLVTSRGAGTAHKFAFEFVRLFKGEKIANQLKKNMLYE